MEELTDSSKAIFFKLTESLKHIGESSIADTGNLDIPVIRSEHVNGSNYGDIYAISQFDDSQDEPLPDPEVTFLVTGDDKVIPLTYDSPSYHEETTNPQGSDLVIDANNQASITSFSNSWLESIKEQHNL